MDMARVQDNSAEYLKHLLLGYLQSELESSQVELASSQTELELYKDKYQQLLEQIALEKQRRFGSSSEKAVDQETAFDEADAEDQTEAGVEETTDVSGYTKKKQRPKRNPLPEEFPRETTVHDIPESEKVCSECGDSLKKIGEEITEQLKIIPSKLVVEQHIRPKYACKACEGKVKIADMPQLLLPKSMATPELVAHTIVSKYEDSLPLYRQERIW